MRIHHLNCGSMCPLGRRWLHGEGGWLAPAHLCCHCLLIEGRHGLTLVDTGLGTGDVTHPARLGRGFLNAARPRLLLAETAIQQVRDLGMSPHEVRHIVPTHLDLDHAGGLGDFPWAQVHVYQTELDAALSRSHVRERGRYVPAQWAHGPKWSPREVMGERWFGFDAVRALPNTDEEVLLVPLAGHSRGHCGVAVRTDRGWLLHCGDAYFFHSEVQAEPDCPMGLSLLQKLLQMHGPSRLANQQRLRELQQAHGAEVTLFCAHDPHELSNMRTRDHRLPAQASALHAA